MTNRDFQINTDILINALEKGVLVAKRCDACAVAVMIAKRMYGTDIIENSFYMHWAYYSAYGNDGIGKQQVEAIGMTGEEAYEVAQAFERAYDRNFSLAEGVVSAIQKMESFVEDLVSHEAL